MKKNIRPLLHAAPFVPFVIRMADGREFHVEHPDFVLASPSETTQVIIEHPDGSETWLSALLITSVERVGSADPAQNLQPK